MDAPAQQTSKSANSGPNRTKNVFNPVVDDVAELFQFAGLTKAEVDALWLEFKKVVYRGEPGAGGELLTVDFVESGIVVQYQIPATLVA